MNDLNAVILAINEKYARSSDQLGYLRALKEAGVTLIQLQNFISSEGLRAPQELSIASP